MTQAVPGYSSSRPPKHWRPALFHLGQLIRERQCGGDSIGKPRTEPDIQTVRFDGHNTTLVFTSLPSYEADEN